jgi:hypothetical protein
MAVYSLLKSFLKRFGFFLEGSIPPNSADDLVPISDVERLSRYVTDLDHYKSGKNEIHWRAFLPSAKEPEELSIMRTEALHEHEVWALGDEAVAAPANRAIYARGDFKRPDVIAISVEGFGNPLYVNPTKAPERHALILGWPPLDPDARKSFAQQLRKRATPHGRPAR